MYNTNIIKIKEMAAPNRNRNKENFQKKKERARQKIIPPKFNNRGARTHII